MSHSCYCYTNELLLRGTVLKEHIHMYIIAVIIIVCIYCFHLYCM